MTDSLEERIRVLEAREAYRDITARYAWCATQAQADAIADLFTKDGSFEKLFEEGRRVIEGREQVRAHMRRSLAPGKLAPLIHNHVIDVVGEEVSATCLMDAAPTAERPGGTLAFYRDRIRKEDGRWLFRSRRVFLIRPTDEFEAILSVDVPVE